MARDFALSLVLWLPACGAAPRPEPNEAFAAIQVEEARIEHALGAAEQGCEGALACPEVRDAAVRLCAIAEALDDRDARERCARAAGRADGCEALGEACGAR